jgi:tRNA(adenine34) deaminase
VIDLAPPWGEVFELMWGAYGAGTIPVGAVVVDAGGAVVARGRNRIYDDAASGQLGRTRLGHAEVNALAQLRPPSTFERFTLYSALEPCHLEARPEVVAAAAALPAPDAGATIADAFAALRS